jgi:biopolymer transport protein ExbD
MKRQLFHIIQLLDNHNMSKFMVSMLLFFMASFVFANNGGNKLENPNLNGITKAFSEGDANALTSYLDAQIDISILGKEQTYTKAQATDMLKSFFDKQKPRAFSINHQGAAKGNDAIYCIASLSGTTNYSVYLYLKSGGANYLIHEIRLDKE